MTTAFSNTRRYELENKIKSTIAEDNNCTVHFDWNFTPPGILVEPPYVKLDLITYNPRHKTNFLLHSIQENCQPHIKVFIIILEKMLTYIQKRTTSIINYSVEWNYRFADKEKHQPIKRSYFQGKNIEEILEKLYYNKERDTIIIYKVEMIAAS